MSNSKSTPSLLDPALVGPAVRDSFRKLDPRSLARNPVIFITAFPERLPALDKDNYRFFWPGPSGKPHFDLESYVAHRLAAAGIGSIEKLGLDTYPDPDRFYSFRRATHRGEADYGRQLSAIGIAA